MFVSYEKLSTYMDNRLLYCQSRLCFDFLFEVLQFPRRSRADRTILSPNGLARFVRTISGENGE